MPPATLADLEARVAALEAERADYRAVLAAVDVLGASQRDLTERVASMETRLGAVDSKLDDTGARVRSIEDGMAEVKDLLVRARDR